MSWRISPAEKHCRVLDLVPTTFNLVDLENEFTGDPKRPAYVIFAEQLAEIEANYDFILFDCPPNILRASQCGIFSANEVYVPCNPDALSLIGFTLLVEKLGKFHQGSASFRLAGDGSARSGAGPDFQFDQDWRRHRGAENASATSAQSIPHGEAGEPASQDF